jgi:hypothetical protein
MDQDIIEIVTEFGMALVEKQHQLFVEESLDNSEHVPAIKRIADTAYEYLKVNRISSDIGKKVREKMISHGRDLFIEEWMRPQEEDEDLPEPQEREEATNTFNELLNGM